MVAANRCRFDLQPQLDQVLSLLPASSISVISIEPLLQPLLLQGHLQDNLKHLKLMEHSLHAALIVFGLTKAHNQAINLVLEFLRLLQRLEKMDRLLQQDIRILDDHVERGILLFDRGLILNPFLFPRGFLLACGKELYIPKPFVHDEFNQCANQLISATLPGLWISIIKAIMFLST